MYSYIQSESALWTVGTGAPGDDWEPESDHSTPESAAQRVAMLNGNNEHKIADLLDLIDSLRKEIAAMNERIERLENPDDPSEYDIRPNWMKNRTQ